MSSTSATPLHRWLLIAALFAIAFAVAAAVGLERLKPSAETPAVPYPALAVQVIPVQASSGFAMRRIFTGRVEAARRSVLGFELGGLLAEVLVEEGDFVQQGQALARLGTARLRARRAELQAGLANAKADLALAELTLERFKDVVKAGGVTRQGLDEAREGFRGAQAGLELAKARLASLDVDIAKAVLVAPFDGVVTERLVDEGRVLNVGSPVLEFQESTVPEIRVGIAGDLLDALQIGNVYALDWQGRTLQARLRSVLPVRSSGGRTVDALFEPQEVPLGLRPGDLVELTLESQVQESGFWLPVSALTEGTRGLWAAYTIEPPTQAVPAGLDADYQLLRQPVEVIYQDGERVYVRGLFRPGQRVVQDGLHRVVPGQLVRVSEDSAYRVALGEH